MRTSPWSGSGSGISPTTSVVRGVGRVVQRVGASRDRAVGRYGLWPARRPRSRSAGPANSAVGSRQPVSVVVLPNPDDGRSSVIELTSAGRRLLTAANRTFAAELDSLIDTAVSARSLQQFTATVGRLRRGLPEVQSEESA